MIIDIPAKNGEITDLENLAMDCHATGDKLVVRAERLLLAILRDPREFGADEVIETNSYNLPAEITENDLLTMAERVHSRATYLNEMIQAYGYEQENTQFFNTIRIKNEDDIATEDLELEGIELKQDGEFLLITILPTVTLDDMNNVIEMLADGVGAMAQEEEDDEAFDGLWALDEEMCK